MAESFNWTCPHCACTAAVSPGTNLATEIHYCPIVSASGPLALISTFTVCPNKECQKATVNVTLRAWDTLPRSSMPVLADTLKSIQLLP